MALIDYSIDTSGTPEDIRRRQAYAEALMKSGGDGSPIRSPWQGLNRLAQGLLGGYLSGSEERKGQEGQRALNQQMAALLQGQSAPASTPAVASASPTLGPTVPNDANAIPGTVGMDQRLADRTQDFIQDNPGTSLSSGVRSTEDQARLYADRANNPNPVAPPGTSLHERGMAADIGGMTPQQRAMLPQYGLAQPVANDPVHVQLADGSAAPNSDDEETPANATPTQGALPTAAPRQSTNVAAAMAIINNPYANAAQKQVAQAIVAQGLKQDQWSSIGNGYVMDQRGNVKRAYEADDKTPTSVSEYKFYKDSFQPTEQQQKPLSYEGFLSAKKAGVGTDSAYSPELLNSLADRLEAGDTTWKTGMARIPGLIKSVEEEVAKRGAARRADNPELKPAETILQNRANQAGRVKEQSTLGTASATNTLYGNAAASTMQTAIEKSNAVPRGKFVPINRLLQTAETAISDPALAELRTATNTLVNDYAKAITPVGTPTDSAREHARELLDMATSPETYERVVRLMHREIENTHKAIEFTKQQLRSGKGGEVPPIAAPPQRETKTIGNRTFYRENGQWFEQ